MLDENTFINIKKLLCSGEISAFKTKEKYMKRTKLVASLLMCVFCLSFLVVGVFAAVNVNFGLTGQLTFNPEGVYVKVSGQMYRGENYGSLAPLTADNYILPEMTNYDEVDGVPAGNLPMSSWETPNVTLVPGERAVKYRIEVTNVSEKGIKGTATATITGTTGTPTTTTASGVKTSVYTNCTITEYAQYIQNIQPNDTQVYELVVELNEGATSATINVSISFDFTDETTYTITGTTKGFVNIGKYPQTYVGDTMNAELESWYTGEQVAETYTAYKGHTSGTLNEPVVYNAYNYIDGNTYCRVPEAEVYFSVGYLSVFNDGTSVESNKTYWFKVEPIQWRVLTENYTDTENTTPVSYLLSEYCLTANTTFNPNTSNLNFTHYSGETNALRPFLNAVFYADAFTNKEQSLIAQRTLKDADMDGSGSIDISSTEALKIFAPSFYDLIKTDYGFGAAYNMDEQRRASATDFAMANYATKSNDLFSTNIHGIASAYYWTSTSLNSDSIYVFSSGGGMASNSGESEEYAVRPALLYNL